jgi:hypothetical protein
MATLLRRYRELDAQALALESATEDTVDGWHEYVSIRSTSHSASNTAT